MALLSFGGRFWAPLIRARPQPEDVAARLAACTAPVCYALENQSAADFEALRQVCSAARLPPSWRLPSTRGPTASPRWGRPFRSAP
mgnify:CR=1 FL=1